MTVKLSITVPRSLYDRIEQVAHVRRMSTPEFIRQGAECAVADHRLQTLPPPNPTAEREAATARVRAYRERQKTLST